MDVHLHCQSTHAVSHRHGYARRMQMMLENPPIPVTALKLESGDYHHFLHSNAYSALQ
jgi:hypothetical protein